MLANDANYEVINGCLPGSGDCKEVGIASHFNSCASSLSWFWRHFGRNFSPLTWPCLQSTHHQWPTSTDTCQVPGSAWIEFSVKAVSNQSNLLEQPISPLLDEILWLPFCPISCHLHLLREKVAPLETPPVPTVTCKQISLSACVSGDWLPLQTWPYPPLILLWFPEKN